MLIIQRYPPPAAMLVQLALGIAIGYGPPPTRRAALRLSAAEPPPPEEPPFSYAEHSLREQASAAASNLVVKPEPVPEPEPKPETKPETKVET